MKQKKVKLDLETAGYRDYVKHFGVVKGAKKWKERKKKEEAKVTTLTPNVIKTADKLIVKKLEEDLEPLQKAILDGAKPQGIRKSRADIMSCGASMIELIKMSGWNKWLKPQIQKDMVDLVTRALMTSGEESHKASGGYNYAKRILKRVNGWIAEYTNLAKEEMEKQNAI